MSEAIRVEGGCRCGRVRFAITAQPLITGACHCRGCQRMTASAFSLSVAVPSDGFAVIRGEPVIGGLHGPAHHQGCGYCLSWLYTQPDGVPFVNVRSTMLDDARWTEPYMETCTDEKLSWVTTPARRSFPSFPPEADYPSLIAAFRAESGVA